MQAASKILESTVNDLIVEARTDYSSEIRLELNTNRLKSRGCTVQDVMSALESNKKFTAESVGNNIILTLVEEYDSSTVVILLNKVKKTTVKGVPGVERVTL